MYRNKNSARIPAGAAALTCLMSGPLQAQTTATEAEDPIEEIVVTGVMIGTNYREAPIAISAITAEDMKKLAPVSAADLLKNVPGVFVNSSLGEIRNVVFSRGVSANSLDAASGYYYVSLQEDGLPVTNVTFTNYGPDYLYRPDATLGRLEAVRGGTATVTGPNAPGGIFNYISRTGAANPGVEVRARYGMEGKSGNQFYRADFYAGNRIGNSPWSYSVGGFYRRSDGARYAGYPLNKGGQVKVNLAYEYEGGEIQIYGKYLNDHNGWYEFLPAKNFDDPKLVSGIKSTDSFLPPRAVHRFTTDGGATYDTWDASNLAHARSNAIGVKWNQDFGNGWTANNNLKYSDNSVDWNSGAVIFPVAINDFFNFGQLNTRNAGGAGTYTFRNRPGGTILAQIVSATGSDWTVTTNNLPNQNVLANGVLTQSANNTHPEAQEWMDQISISKKTESMTFTLGGFLGISDVKLLAGFAGFGFSPIQDQPQLMDITLTTPGGVVRNLTSPEGFASIGVLGGGGARKSTKQTQMSLFFGHNWKINDPLTLDWGVRYESMRTKGQNNANGFTAAPSQATGGLDGVVNTWYDNFAQLANAPLAYSKTLNFLNFTGSLSYRISDSNFTYVRYSDGKKAPDVQYYQGLNTPFLISTDPVAQHIQQFEVGYRFNSGRFQVAASPFYSKLSDVGSTTPFVDNLNISYSNPTLYSSTITYGVELESDVKLSPQFSVHASATLQDPKSKDFRTWVANTPVRTDDTIASVPDGDADNNPKVMASAQLNYAPVERFSSFISWRYTGERAANRYNTWYMPGFSQIDLGANFDATAAINFSLNVNNVFDSRGVMSWAKAGSFLSALDRQAFTPADLAANPNQTFNILTIQPRSYFLSATYKF